MAKKKEKGPWTPTEIDPETLRSRTVMDALRESHLPSVGGAPILGEALLAAPENQDIVLDFTTPMGMCSNVYYSFVFQLPKWSYNVKKVDEFMDVSPVHADAYNLMVSQRQKLESAIKQGLSSAAEAVTHYELLAHDARRYLEILHYFKEGEKDEHVLRSLFVDRVDAHTGEGYSLITMTKRWPTIITDFIRMRSDWDDINRIRERLDVSQAEATVLKTKNQLYVEWKTLFKPTVVERYARIKTMVDARKRSIDEYKKWLKPYITRHKMMRESPETRASENVTSPYMVPGFGQAVMFSGVKLWVWKPFNPTEPGKPESLAEAKPWGAWEIDPYDDFVKRWIPYIRYKYEISERDLNDSVVRNLMKGWSSSSTESPLPLIDPTRPYYIFFDVMVARSVIKTPPPSGGELENIMLTPLRTYIISQNVLLLHLIELWAINKRFDREVDELIGASHLERAEEEKLWKELRSEVEKEEKENLFRRFGRSAGGAKKRVKPFSRYFFRPGPYESNFKERVTKIYLVGAGGIYQQMVDFWKKNMGVG